MTLTQRLRTLAPSHNPKPSKKAAQITQEMIEAQDFPGDSLSSIAFWVSQWPRLLVGATFGWPSQQEKSARALLYFRGACADKAAADSALRVWCNYLAQLDSDEMRLNALLLSYESRMAALGAPCAPKEFLVEYTDFWLEAFYRYFGSVNQGKGNRCDPSDS